MILSGSPRILLAAVTTTTMFALAACGDSESASDAADTPIVATTSIWADVTSNVGCGAEIPALIPRGADPHGFEPSLRDRELVEGATTVIANGLELEEPILPMLDAAANESGVNVIELSIDVDVLMPDDDEHGDEEHADEEHADDEHADDEEHDGDGPVDDDHSHSHGEGGDPHFWQDPLRVSGTLDTIATALSANDIDTCVDEYRAELEALDAEIETILEPIPADARVLVTSHESLAYFADRYGFEVIGTVIPSMSTMAETNAADLAELAQEIDVHGVSAIFTEELSSNTDADALAERLGVAVVPLVTDSLTDAPDSDTYVEMMRHNATLVARELAP